MRVTAVVAGRVGVGGAAAGAAPAAGAFVGAAEASAPHSAFRKSFHFIPFSVPAACAALYLALHSFIVRACAVETCAANIAATSVTAQIVAERTSIKSSLTDVPQTTGIIARHDSRVHLIAPFSTDAIRDQALEGSAQPLGRAASLNGRSHPSRPQKICLMSVAKHDVVRR